MVNNLSDSFKNTISLSNLGDIAKETAEVTIDTFLKEGVLKELPIVGSIIGVGKQNHH